MCLRACNSDSRYSSEDYMSGVTFGPSPKPKTQLEKCREWIRLCNHPHTDLSVNKTGGSPSGRWVRAVPSSLGTVPPQVVFSGGLRSRPSPRCPTTGTRQHSVLSGPARGHHVVTLPSGSGSCLCPLHVTTGTRSGKRQNRL
ncbi:hypothetical protein PoB_000567100 [Plakobranchus ocellatus]|uniref:Uncharacterized protein n=1 Tax=Plakobranchus ocellatus TaxID=259542 RepID=A0AAV3Y9T2_9GAST|nr:hypothetical protein PoB_000567100 [Plakobranchus ocellatus]